MEFSFWAIALSIVVGVITNIMTPHISQLFGRISNSIKVSNEKKKIIFANTVQYLSNNPHEEIIFKINFLQSVLSITLVLFLSVFMMLSNNLIVVIVGFILSLAMYYKIIKINNRRKISEELIKTKKMAHPDINLE